MFEIIKWVCQIQVLLSKLLTCSKLLVSNTTIFFFDWGTCFLILKDVLISKHKSYICLILTRLSNISWKYRGQVSLKNLKVLEQNYWLNLSKIGSQLSFSKSFIPVWLLLSSWRQYLIHLFWTVCSLLWNFLFRFGY